MSSTANRPRQQPLADPCAGQRVKMVVFLSRRAAEEMPPPPFAPIISVHDASEPPALLDERWAERLTLSFHDTQDSEGVQTTYSNDHAAAVLDLLVRHRDTAPAIYVHCSLGVSRSAGIALAAAQLLGVPCYKAGAPVALDSYPFYNRLVHHRTIDVACSPRFDDLF